MLARWAHLIGLLAALGAICFWQPILWAKPGCCLSCVTDCYMSYIVCKVERFVLTN